MPRPILSDFEKRVEKRVKARKAKNYGQETPTSRDLAVMDEMEIEEERAAARAKAEGARSRLAQRLKAAIVNDPSDSKEDRSAITVSVATSTITVIDGLRRQWGLKRGQTIDRLVELFAMDQEEDHDDEDQDEEDDDTDRLARQRAQAAHKSEETPASTGRRRHHID